MDCGVDCKEIVRREIAGETPMEASITQLVASHQEVLETGTKRAQAMQQLVSKIVEMIAELV